MPLKPLPLFAASHLQAMAASLERLGVPTRRALRRARLPSDLSDFPGGFVPLLNSVAFLADVTRREGDAALALKVGMGHDFTQIGSLGRTIARSTTVYDAARTLVTHVKFHSNQIAYALTCRDGEYILSNTTYADTTLAVTFGAVEHYVLNLMIGLVRLGAGPEWTPDRIWLRSARELCRPVERAFPDADILYRQNALGISIPKHVIALPLRTGRESGRSATPGAGTPRRSPVPSDFTGALRELAKSHLRGNDFTLDLASEIIGMSRRTLQRRIADGGSSFSRVVDEARFEAARDLMLGGDLDITDIAYEVGYGHPNNFSRAFRQWAGVSPRAFLRAGTSAMP